MTTDLRRTDPARNGSLVAWALGLAGLIPFWGAALALWVGPPTLRGAALLALLAYAAVILSFVGGARWGVEAARPEGPRAAPLVLSILASLLAWGALVGAASVPPAGQLLLLGAGLLLAGLWDILAASLPSWYRRLRMVLTVGALLAVVVGWLQARQLG